jgi:class 3 adenylate cyclase
MYCAQCQHVNPEGARFCNACGAWLEAVRPAASQGYTPKHLATQILTSRSVLEGERKEITVLFCDTADTSHLAERLDPEVIHQLMDRVLRLTAEAVHRYEGTVNHRCPSPAANCHAA